MLSKNNLIRLKNKDNLIFNDFIFKCSIGKNGLSSNKVEGDKKTPEGYYFIDGKNAKSKFFLSLHTSYPNFHDKQIALKNKVNPGEHIAIHGLPPLNLLAQYLFDGADWTDGCIALNNSDMKELWDLTEEGTQILIRP